MSSVIPHPSSKNSWSLSSSSAIIIGSCCVFVNYFIPYPKCFFFYMMDVAGPVFWRNAMNSPSNKSDNIFRGVSVDIFTTNFIFHLAPHHFDCIETAVVRGQPQDFMTKFFRRPRTFSGYLDFLPFVKVQVLLGLVRYWASPFPEKFYYFFITVSLTQYLLAQSTMILGIVNYYHF